MARKLPQILTEEEFNKLVGVTETPRDNIMIKFMYYTGVRVNELTHIKKQDINFKESTVNIKYAKRNKERHQPLPKIFLKQLQDYCRLIGDVRLFPITNQRVWQIIKKYAKKANINKNIHPHTLRHSFATRIYEQKEDLGFVQELLDHESVATTGIYKHLSTKRKKATVDEVFK